MDAFVIVCPRNTNESISYGWVMDARKVTHGAKLPSPKTLRKRRKMASAASEAHETPRLSATFSSHDPFKTARLNQEGKTNYVIAVGLLQHSPRRITKPYTAFCETKKSRAFKPPKVANSGGPVPVAQSRWPSPGGPVPWPGPGPVPVTCPGGPVPVPLARSRWPAPGPGLGGPVPVPGPGGPVPVARSRWPRWPGAVARSRCRFKGRVPAGPRKKRPILNSTVVTPILGAYVALSSTHSL